VKTTGELLKGRGRGAVAGWLVVGYTPARLWKVG
jgi:hypothetical protein